ncbi:MAG: NAD(P)H-dependent oxidoreductase subunit E [Deltaproteobacteria bacterium]|nr:NAD(P)H-dependent oxidoreductase subunit E [Deltaproteobacteria bacterium]
MNAETGNCMCEQVDEVLDRYDRDAGLLVSILQDVQEVYRYLPREALEKVSEALNVPMAQVYAVATFFKAFSLEPRGKQVFQVCMGTACHVRGAQLILDKLERDLELAPGTTSEDLDYTLESVNCVGACALGPVVVVNDEVKGHIKLDKVDGLVEKARKCLSELNQ